MDYTLTLPGGGILAGRRSVVVIGPNGSGKTRQTRQITASVPIECINALRNTRVAPELPAMGVETARTNFHNVRNQTRSNHWEISSDFDFMLSQLLAQHSIACVEYVRRVKEEPNSASIPEETALAKIEQLWGEVFAGRELTWNDWKPFVKNKSTGREVTYTANAMSDGEKAVLYLAGRVFSANPGVLIVDEPETHLHSLLAVKLWNKLEEARPDIRFVYVTHDFTFALSRKSADFVLASPTEGLRTIDIQNTLPADVTEALLGSASLSFYASRVIFCEGEVTSIDNQLYEAWFNGPDTVVRPVRTCDRVLRCVEAVNESDIAVGLTAEGIIDGDYHPDAFVGSLKSAVSTLRVHEVESLLCLPGIVSAVCRHLSQPFDVETYRQTLAGQVSEAQRHQIIIERWKRRITPHLEGLVSGVSKRQMGVDALAKSLPELFNLANWNFSPETFLLEEKERVEAIIPNGSLNDLLLIVPGKILLPAVARLAGMNITSYQKLIFDSLRSGTASRTELAAQIESTLADYLPARSVPVRALSLPL